MKIDYDNITNIVAARKYYITGEYPDGSPYCHYLVMNETVLTPCLKK